MKLKVLSWNIWIDGYFGQAADFLKMSQADIIGLQEVVNDDPNRNVFKILEGIGYESAFGYAEHSWGGKVYKDGPVIFSKYKIVKRGTHTLSEKDPRAAVQADIVAGHKILHVLSTHLLHTHQKDSEEQNIQARNLIGILPKQRTILMGDFNATPESYTIKKMRGVLVDTDPNSKPTWSNYPEGCLVCKPKKIDTRLDYIFTTKDIKPIDFKVENSKASDHLPISTVLEI